MRDMISVASGFQYSVNIGYDLGSDDKLRNFIPTKSALSLLEEILLSITPTSTDRARVLIGAYGKGKSHIVLSILSMLHKRDLALFEKMMPRIKENPRLYQLVQNYYESENKILPVVISGSNTSLTQAFLISLQRTLSEYNLLSAMPDTNYQAATNVIRRWEKDFSETFAKFQEAIDEPIDVMIERLENYDVAAYETFERIYPTLTAGSVFNPFLGFDVVELYESVAKSLKPMGYTGLYVVYDEFSKFLEANIVDASVSDTKMLQDFAEKCCRSGALQLHLMLISHKEISNYIDKLPKEKTDGWRGVSERFKHIHMNNNFIQTYEIISSVIQHAEPRWRTFCDTHDSDFEALFLRYRKHQMFTDAQGEIETAIRGCFPLHPVSTFILPRLSERVAQNERTLFTFLSAEGTATLASFLDVYENDFTFLRSLNLGISDIIHAIEVVTQDYISNIDAVQNQIHALVELIRGNFIPIEEKISKDWNAELEIIFRSFHKVARQLRTRHDERETLIIHDEYDVQDLLHALLLLFFLDVRTEEWTPSYAGGAVRADFLLKEYKTMIEVKKTRYSFTSKALGEELIIDCEKYQQHPDCEKLYCFVYDPEGLLGNPVGIKNDLENAHKGFLRVFIMPE